MASGTRLSCQKRPKHHSGRSGKHPTAAHLKEKMKELRRTGNSTQGHGANKHIMLTQAQESKSARGSRW
jgi:hypothetical protein